jgi:hypothetical protein
MRNRVYLPPSLGAAERHFRAAQSGQIEEMSTSDFLKAYCSLAYLHPGFHPDGIDDWDGSQEILPTAN